MMLPSNLDADQARVVTLTLAAYSKLEQVRVDPYPGEEDEAAEERSLDCIQEQMDDLSEEEFAELIRALVEAWDAPQHTSGPWFIVRYGDGDSLVICRDQAGEQRVAFLATPGCRDESERQKVWKRIKADARLISAAPDLLEAAVAMVEHGKPSNWDDEDQPGEPGHDYANAWRSLEAAIAKAKGIAA